MFDWLLARAGIRKARNAQQNFCDSLQALKDAMQKLEETKPPTPDPTPEPVKSYVESLNFTDDWEWRHSEEHALGEDRSKYTRWINERNGQK